jgi:UDP-glucose 4-epimerase
MVACIYWVSINVERRVMPWIALRYFNAAGADPDGDIGEDHNPETHLNPLVLRAETPVGI